MPDGARKGKVPGRIGGEGRMPIQKEELKCYVYLCSLQGLGVAKVVIIVVPHNRLVDTLLFCCWY